MGKNWFRACLSRREFMVGVGLGSGMWLTGCVPQAQRRTWRTLTESEVRLLEGITEQIIPTDQDPGAKEAGCVNFIDKQLVGFYRHYRNIYRKGLIGIDQTSLSLYGQPFLKITWEEQTQVLKALESGQAKGSIWQDVSCREFFRLVRDHTMQGFYGSPRHGGNKDYISYRMMGLDYPQIVGQNRYSKLDFE